MTAESPSSPREPDELKAELERIALALEQSDADGDNEKTAALHFKAAQIYLTRPDSSEPAKQHLWASWQLQPENLDFRLVLGHRLELEDQPLEAADLYRRSAELVADEKEKADLLLRAFDLLKAAEAYPAALEVNRRMEEMTDPLQRQRRVPALWSIIERITPQDDAQSSTRIEALSLLLPELHGEKRFTCAMEMASLWERAGDQDKAYSAYRQALSIRPAVPEVLDPVLKYLERREAHEELASVLEGAAQATPRRKERAALLRRQARIIEENLSDPKRAAQYWWRAWELDPASADPPANLKRIYADFQDWHQYRRVLKRETLCTLDTEAKVTAYRELASFQRQVFSDALGAAETYGFILHLIPDDEAALAARVEIFEEEKQEEALIVALRRQAAYTAEGERKNKLLRRLARLQSQRPSQAANLIRTLQQLDPKDVANRDLIRELRGHSSPPSQTWSLDLGALLLGFERRAGTDTAACVELGLSLAEECTQLDAIGRAADFLRQVLEMQPDHAEAQKRLEETTRHHELVDPTIDELAAEAEQLAQHQPERAVKLLVRVARMLAHQRSDKKSVAQFLRRAVAICPADTVVELNMLEDALWSAKLHEELAKLLERQVEHEEARARRINLLRALARIYQDQLKKPKHAVKTLKRVLVIDPKDKEVIHEVRRLHTELQNHEELAEVLEDLLSFAAGDARIPLLEELGKLYADHLKDDAAAQSRYGELLSIQPNHVEALNHCKDHDRAAGDHRSVAVLLCRAAEATEDLIARAELHREIAKIAERHLNDPDFAITHWHRVVDLCPSDSAPRAELKRILSQVGRWREVERVLLSEVSRSLRPEEKVPVYRELAQVAFQHLDDNRAAASYLRNALQLAPEDEEVLSQLENLYERQGQWRELTNVLARHSEVAKEKEEKTKLLHRGARILFVHLTRYEEALVMCRMIRELHPGDRIAATLMGEIYTKRGNWREKAALLREQIASETDPPELGRLHLELGRILLDQLNDAQEAAVHFEKALELDRGGGEVLPLLRQLYESLNRWDQLVELIRRRAAAETISNSERAAALCEIGRITEEHLSDLAGAKEAYERAIHLDPKHRPALTALRALSTAREQWRDVVAMARRELHLTEDKAERARLLVEMGEVLHKKMDRANTAAEALEEALQNDPGNLRAAERLGMIYFDNEDWERAGEFLEKVVSSGLELDNLHDYYYRLGFATERLGQEDDAFSYYVKSFGREPMYLPTLERLVELCYTRQQWDNTLRISEAIISTYAEKKTPQQLGDLYVKVGLSEIHLAQRDVAVKQLQNIILEHGEVPRAPLDAWVDAAESWAATPLEPHLLQLVNPDVLSRVIKAMEQALIHAPNHIKALQVLAALSITRGDWERSLRFMERTVESIGDKPRLKVGILVCAGDVAYRRLLSAKRAEVYYRGALEVLPGSELARDRLDMLQVTPAYGKELPAPPPLEGARSASPPLPPEDHLPRTRTKPLPVGMPPIPPPTVKEVPSPPVKGPTEEKAPAKRPAPRSRPRRPDDE